MRRWVREALWGKVREAPGEALRAGEAPQDALLAREASREAMRTREAPREALREALRESAAKKKKI